MLPILTLGDTSSFLPISITFDLELLIQLEPTLNDFGVEGSDIGTGKLHKGFPQFDRVVQTQVELRDHATSAEAQLSHLGGAEKFSTKGTVSFP